MKIARIGAAGREKPTICENGTYYDISSKVPAIDENFLGGDGIEELAVWFEANKASCPTVEPDRIGMPLERPSKIICVGLNYSKHAQESGMELPKEPVLFFKATTAVSGPFDDVVIPKNSVKSDWEVELAIVIGKKAKYVGEEDAMDHVAGYVLHNDLSEREWQLEKSGQWVKGKSADTFAPLGPWLVTKDEIRDPHDLHIWLKLNGETLQDSSTSDLVFKVPHLVSYISQFMTLLPGDIISTGTPSGVGLGLDPQRYLKPGDVMELGVEGLGIAKQKVVAEN